MLLQLKKTKRCGGRFFGGQRRFAAVLFPSPCVSNVFFSYEQGIKIAHMVRQIKPNLIAWKGFSLPFFLLLLLLFSQDFESVLYCGYSFKKIIL